MNPELKPCPFCGESLICDPNEGAPFWVHRNRIKSDCWLADSWVKDEAEGEGGILEWNTRALLQTLPAPGEVDFLAAIHERTPTGAWIAVQHHPEGDWSVAEYPLPWLPGGEVASPPTLPTPGEVERPLDRNDLYRFMDTLKLSEKREVASAIGFDPAYVPGERDMDRWKRMWLWAAENDKKPALAAAIRSLLPTKALATVAAANDGGGGCD